jgi:hypothetical protein
MGITANGAIPPRSPSKDMHTVKTLHYKIPEAELHPDRPSMPKFNSQPKENKTRLHYKDLLVIQFREMIAVYLENCTESRNTLFCQNYNFLIVKAVATHIYQCLRDNLDI